MALKDVVEGIENRVDHLLHHEQADPAEQRRPVLEAIDCVADQWKNKRDGENHVWWSESDGLVAFSPTLSNGAPLTIDGVTTNFIPADRFPDYLASMRHEVEKGTFDAEIHGGLTGSGNVSGLATVPLTRSRDGEVGPSEGAPDHDGLSDRVQDS
jgi:hypothetical protein